MERSIALTGFMTAGKSSIGPQLAMRLGLGFTDLDALLVQEEGAGIGELFERYGEAGFRERESGLLRAALNGPACVLSTGGGIIHSEDNRRRLARGSTVVWLDLRFETVRFRLSEAGGSTRPLVRQLGPEGLRDLHYRRRPLYASCADLRIDADRAAPGRLARHIAAHLQRDASL